LDSAEGTEWTLYLLFHRAQEIEHGRPAMRAFDRAPQQVSLGAACAKRRIGSSDYVERVRGIVGEQDESMGLSGLLLRKQQLTMCLQ
jgi:hypothetical protein